MHNRNSDGNLYVRYLYWDDGAWNRNYNWLDNDWNVQNPAAMLASLLISLPIFFWESFVLKVVPATHQAFCPLRLKVRIGLGNIFARENVFPRG